MAIKRVISPERVRKIPAQFSWVDHRLVRDRYIERCDAQGLALYLFLITVADAQGLSYYSDGSLARSLTIDMSHLNEARGALIREGLIAYQRPLYQVLALDPPLSVQTHDVAPEDLDARIEQLRAALRQAAP